MKSKTLQRRKFASTVEEASDGSHASLDNRGFRIIVVGASAGGVEALSRLVKTLPANLPAAVFVVLHISASTPSLLPEILTRAGKLPARHAVDGEPIEPGNIYIAPPDHHMLIKPGRIAVTRGPSENNARPAVDPLFRTAASVYGPWVVGIILSGGLDDGTLGLMDIKRAGGVTLVQDPTEAMFPSMPSSAIENVVVDRVLPLAEMGPLISRLVREPVPFDAEAPLAGRLNGSDAPDIAEVGNDHLKNEAMDAPPSKFTCPQCHGVLWELQNGGLLRYRCHVGHGYTAESLMMAQHGKVEDAMWSGLRVLEEYAGMRRRMADRSRKGGWEIIARKYEQQAETAEVRAGLIRAVLVKNNPREITGNTAREVEETAIAARDPDDQFGRDDIAATGRVSQPADPENGTMELPDLQPRRRGKKSAAPIKSRARRPVKSIGAGQS